MTYDLRPLTTAQLGRLFHKLWRRMTHGDGYQPFGYDMPTLWATHPGWMTAIDATSTELKRRRHS